MKRLFQNFAQNPEKLRNLLIGFEFLLISVYLLTSLSQTPNRYVHYLFNLGREFNIPSLFSAVQLFFVGYVFLLLGSLFKKESLSVTSLYKALGILFLYLSIDEFFMLHEYATFSLRNVDWFPRKMLTSSGQADWLIPSIIGLVFIIFYFKRIIILLRLNYRETSMMGVGVFIFLIGALILDMNDWFFRRFVIAHYIQIIGEEFLEMIGITIVFYGVLLLYKKTFREQSL